MKLFLEVSMESRDNHWTKFVRNEVVQRKHCPWRLSCVQKILTEIICRKILGNRKKILHLWILGVIYILRNHQGGGGFRNDYANVIFALSNAEFDYGRGWGSRNRQKVICERPLTSSGVSAINFSLCSFNLSLSSNSSIYSSHSFRRSSSLGYIILYSSAHFCVPINGLELSEIWYVKPWEFHDNYIYHSI